MRRFERCGASSTAKGITVSRGPDGDIMIVKTRWNARQRPFAGMLRRAVVIGLGKPGI